MNSSEQPFHQRTRKSETGPDNLIQGMAEYIVLQTISSKLDTVNYSNNSPGKRKDGWRMITKGILNTSAPQHMIFQDNLKKINPETQTEKYYKAFRLAEVQQVKRGRFDKSEHFLKKNQENKKIVGLFARAQRRIEDLEQIKSSLSNYKENKWMSQMRKHVQSNSIFSHRAAQNPTINQDETDTHDMFSTADNRHTARQHQNYNNNRDLYFNDESDYSEDGDGSLELIYNENDPNVGRPQHEAVTLRLYKNMTKAAEAKIQEQKQMLKVKENLQKTGKRRTNPLQQRLEHIRQKSRLENVVEAPQIMVTSSRGQRMVIKDGKLQPSSKQQSRDTSLELQPHMFAKHLRQSSEDGIRKRRRQSAVVSSPKQIQISGKPTHVSKTIATDDALSIPHQPKTDKILKSQQVLREKLMKYISSDDDCSVEPQPKQQKTQEFTLKPAQGLDKKQRHFNYATAMAKYSEGQLLHFYR